MPKTAAGFKSDWSDVVRVVFFAFVLFGKGVGVAWDDRDVVGTRQGSCCCGGGDHNVKVEGLGLGDLGDFISNAETKS